MYRVSVPLQLVTGPVTDSAPELAERRDCRRFAAMKPKAFGSMKRMTVGMSAQAVISRRTSEARPLRTMFSISVVIIPLASLMNDSYDSTTLTERMDIEAPSDEEIACPFSSWFSGALSRLPTRNVQVGYQRWFHRTHRAPRCLALLWQ